MLSGLPRSWKGERDLGDVFMERNSSSQLKTETDVADYLAAAFETCDAQRTQPNRSRRSPDHDGISELRITIVEIRVTARFYNAIGEGAIPTLSRGGEVGDAFRSSQRHALVLKRLGGRLAHGFRLRS